MRRPPAQAGPRPKRKPVPAFVEAAYVPRPVPLTSSRDGSLKGQSSKSAPMLPAVKGATRLAVELPKVAEEAAATKAPKVPKVGICWTRNQVYIGPLGSPEAWNATGAGKLAQMRRKVAFVILRLLRGRQTRHARLRRAHPSRSPGW